MTALILILGQVIFLALALKIIFSLIDKLVLLYRRKFRSKRKFERKAIKNPHRYASWNQLLTRVDVATAERLINQLKTKHPGQNDKWYIEKAINDLERDRRS